MLTTFPGMIMKVNPVEPKAVDPIVVTVLGMEMLLSDLQHQKAVWSIISRPSCKVTLSSEVHEENAPIDISLREAGISTDTRFKQSLKEHCSILLRFSESLIELMVQ